MTRHERLPWSAHSPRETDAYLAAIESVLDSQDKENVLCNLQPFLGVLAVLHIDEAETNRN